ncbi:MAG: hypothetical protein HGA31_00800 [Candidatus Moranbacteria bacterium]|nr:hypothetical protein [Candidatus Moranbacteria bacterium]
METQVSSGDVHGRNAQCTQCTECSKRAADEEIAFAFLLALMPVITLTLFGNMGLL